jgi:hypothetical protein
MSKSYSRIGDLCDRYGVVPQTIRRWMNDPRVAFPRPRIRAGNGVMSHRLWDDDELADYDARGGQAPK